MIVDRESLLVGAVFGAQILVLSFLVPGRVRRFYEQLFARCPERDYPRLYPVPQPQMARQMARYRPIPLLVGLSGAVTLGAGLAYFDSPLQLARAMVFVCGLQFLSLVVRLPWQLRMARAFREMPAPSVRSVELRAWRAADFVPPALIGLGLCGSALALASAALVYVQHAGSPVLIAYSAVVNAALLTRMLYVILGPRTWVRPDPYMSETDVFRVRQQRMRLLFGGAALLGVYFAFMTIYRTSRIPVDIVYVSVIVSVLLQVLMLWGVTRLVRAMQTRDFSVYRVGHATGPALGGQ
jgi:hypothetical protein